MDYRVFHAEAIQEKYNFNGKKYLDVGCGDGTMVKYIVENYAPEYAYGVDLDRATEKGENYTLMAGDARKLPFEDNTFDIVTTIATFEHINGIPEALAEIRRVLKPFGTCYISFSPVWTSVCGNHAYSWYPACSNECKAKCLPKDKSVVEAVPPWGHLYMSPQEMKEHLLSKGFDEVRADNFNAYVYESDILNRCSASEIRNWIMNSGMIIRKYYEQITFSRQWAMDEKGPSELTEEIVKKVEKAGYKVTDLGIVGVDAVLEKYANL